jgi:hypothetical protein
MTKKQMVVEYPQLALERDRYMLALGDQLNNEVCWSNWVKDPYSAGKFRVGASRLESASGGLLLVTFRHPGQRDYTTVYDADGFEALNPAIEACVYQARTSYREAA